MVPVSRLTPDFAALKSPRAERPLTRRALALPAAASGTGAVGGSGTLHENVPLSRAKWTKRKGTEKERGEEGAESSPKPPGAAPARLRAAPRPLRVNFLAGGGSGQRPREPAGPARAPG